ncbi:hypothetical protein AAG906_010845 [Vitis piasezkii]
MTPYKYETAAKRTLSMEKLQQILLLFLAFHFLKAGSQVFDTTGWLSIDCGAEYPRLSNNLIVWEPDGRLIKTGFNRKVQEKQDLEEMNTLRSFHDVLSEEHCYKLPVYKLTLRYIIRAGFFYGNYDGLSRPPTFNLTVEGKMWTTVNTSSMDGSPVYHEISYMSHRSGEISVCLVQTREGEAPFISSLEAVPMWVKLFPKLTSTATIHLVTRTNFGGPEVRVTWGYVQPHMDTRGNTTQLSEGFHHASRYYVRDRKQATYGGCRNSIEPINPSDPIILSIPLPPLIPQVARFVFYFSDLSCQVHEGSDTRTVPRITQIYINGSPQSDPVKFKSCSCKVVYSQRINVKAGSVVNLTLAATNESKLPPMLSAMEMFTWEDMEDHRGASSITACESFFTLCIILIQALYFLALEI